MGIEDSARKDEVDLGALPEPDPNATPPILKRMQPVHDPHAHNKTKELREDYSRMMWLYQKEEVEEAGLVADELIFKWNRCPEKLQPTELPFFDAAVFTILHSGSKRISYILAAIEQIEGGTAEGDIPAFVKEAAMLVPAYRALQKRYADVLANEQLHKAYLVDPILRELHNISRQAELRIEADVIAERLGQIRIELEQMKIQHHPVTDY